MTKLADLFAQMRNDLDAAESISATATAKDCVVEANRQLLLERSNVGVSKYGTTLANSKLTLDEFHRHALEEALDLANYLQAASAVGTAMQAALVELLDDPYSPDVRAKAIAVLAQTGKVYSGKLQGYTTSAPSPAEPFEPKAKPPEWAADMFWMWRELNSYMLDRGNVFTPSEIHAAARVVSRLRRYGFDVGLHPETLPPKES